MSSDQDRRDPVVRLFGALLMTVGVLMMTLCGLCSLVGVIYAVESGGSDMGFSLLFVLSFGGVPIIVGLGIFWLGRSLRAPKRR
jgi:hypothetical protein